MSPSSYYRCVSGKNTVLVNGAAGFATAPAQGKVDVALIKAKGPRGDQVRPSEEGEEDEARRAVTHYNVVDKAPPVTTRFCKCIDRSRPARPARPCLAPAR